MGLEFRGEAAAMGDPALADGLGAGDWRWGCSRVGPKILNLAGVEMALFTWPHDTPAFKLQGPILYVFVTSRVRSFKLLIIWYKFCYVSQQEGLLITQ